MEWRQNHHSRAEIDRAGEVLRQDQHRHGDNFVFSKYQDYLRALSIMDDWRASHAFPLNTFQVSLRKRARIISPASEVFQRMKRAQSVILKLQRFPRMQLSRMQDLGGCRAILEANDQVESVRQLYLESRDRHKLAGEKNYIDQPRDSGYRGRHLIYRYQSDRNEIFNNHRIEIQLRSRPQHYWATAVEVAGLFVQSSLKSSIGPDDWLEFFRYASSCFSIYEGTTVLHSDLSRKEVIEGAKMVERHLDACTQLRRFSQSHSVLTEQVKPGSTHFVLSLDVETNTLRIEAFYGAAAASERYAELEQETVDRPLLDIVMVAAENIDSLARGYPNYFSDTEEFIALFRDITEG